MVRMKSAAQYRTTLVAGGAGFLGSHLCEALLEAGHRVICVDNYSTGTAQNLRHLSRHPGFSLLEQDIRHPIDGSLPKLDQIYNLASPAAPPHYQKDPTATLMTNVVGTEQLLSLAARHGARFLQASTSEVYGDPLQHPQTEDYWGHVSCTGPRACYDEGKRAAETLCFDRLRVGQDVRIARIFNTYGPRMRPDDGRIISNFILQALQGLPLTVYGSGQQTRSMCFVSDLIRGLMGLMTLQDNPEAPVNLGNPTEYTVRQVAEQILLLTGSASSLALKPLPQDDPKRRRPDISRARQLLDWAPEIALRKGLLMTIPWFRESLNKMEPPRPRPVRSPVPVTASQALG